MKIFDLTIERLEIPFKLSFSHASATRNMTDSIIVKAKTQQNVGYGESCPRIYVTNETYQSVSTFFQTHKSSLIVSISNLVSLKLWISEHRNGIDRNPAAWCAIELSLLDLLAKELNCTVESLLQLPELSGSYDYTAVLGDSSLDGFSKLVERYNLMGFVDFKIKLTGDIEHDKAKCDLVVGKVKHARIRLDANNLWYTSDEAISYMRELGHSIFAIEEPLQANNYDDLLSISTELGLKIILDESFLRLQQFSYLLDTPDKWIINIRVSKMGGLLRSIDIVNKAKQLQIDCIVGAQVGETTILTRSALTVVNAYRDVIIAQEGGCGTYLLKHDICDPILMFTAGGKITEGQVASLGERGFGLIMHSPQV